MKTAANTKLSLKEFADLAFNRFGRISCTKREFMELAKDSSSPVPFIMDHNTADPERPAHFRIPNVRDPSVSLIKVKNDDAHSPVIEQNKASVNVVSAEEISYVPTANPSFVPWGIFFDVKTIIHSKIFYPSYHVGPSGTGKTEAIIQAANQAGRELLRVNITEETDEDDLFGGFRLIKGETVWVDGPVVEAANRGAILLLDEIDLASPKIMILQPVLEGKPFFIKKISRYVYPKPGFNVFATANTKGKGSDTGEFMGTNVLNEAFLDRFAVTMEWGYPANKKEIKILTTVAGTIFPDDLSREESNKLAHFIGCLVSWATGVRKQHESGLHTETISPRRLITILTSYAVFGSKKKAIRLGISRFDEEHKTVFAQYYAALDATVDSNLDDREETKPEPTRARSRPNVKFDELDDLEPF